MKKTSLTLLNLDAGNLLQREQLKTVLGGAGGKYTCEEIWAIPLCCHPNWTSVCGFTPPGAMCSNGVCYM